MTEEGTEEKSRSLMEVFLDDLCRPATRGITMRVSLPLLGVDVDGRWMLKKGE